MISGNLGIIEQASRQFLTVMLSTSLKGLLIITCVYIIFSSTKKINARVRHLVWFLSIIGFILIPVFSLLLQPIKIGIFTLPKSPGRVYQTFTSVIAMDLNTSYNLQGIQSIQSQTAHGTGAASTTLRWTLCFIVWLAGALAAFIRSSYGKVQAGRIVKNSEMLRQGKVVSLLDDLCRENNMKLSIDLYSSKRVSSPFTVGVFNPVIILPSKITAWSIVDLKPVLLHEIYHIKRNDYLTQTAAALICTLFWFVPVIWLALKKLYGEQENVCDEEVIRNGIKPRHYAEQMLRIASSIVSAAASPGLFMVNGRTKLFERRIINILEERGKKMKKNQFIFICFIFLLVLVGIAGCVTKGKAISEEDFFKTWSGTWTNEELTGTPWVPQKIITYPDGAHDIYVLATDSINAWQHRITLIDKWTDKEGNIWYTASFENSSGNAYNGYEFGKISDSGNTLERLTRASNEPIKKWEPDNEYYNYGIYYRE